MELIIGAVVIFAVGRYILQGYSTANTLITGGLLLLIVSAYMGNSVLPSSATSTGFTITDIAESVKILLISSTTNIGLLIMLLCGFSAYMVHIGADAAIVQCAAIPLKKIGSPYLLMVLAYLIACLMSLAISSATGLGVLLMATLFPVMVNVGISRAAAAAICASPVAVILSPTSGDMILAAQAAEVPLFDFAFKTTLPISIAAIIGMAIAHFFWQRYLDQQMQQPDMVAPSVTEISHSSLKKVPALYMVLPCLPIIGVLVFDGVWGPDLHIITIVIICIAIVSLLEFCRSFSASHVFSGLEIVYRGMADGFNTVVILLVAASIFAHGLNTIGFIDQLINLAHSFGAGGLVMMLTLVLLTLLVAMTTGSGNAPFYAFVELIPKLAQQMGINSTYLVIPMLQASNLGRTLSPVSAVLVAVSAMAKVPAFTILKRMSVPVLVGLTVVIVATALFVPQVKAITG